MRGVWHRFIKTAQGIALALVLITPGSQEAVGQGPPPHPTQLEPSSTVCIANKDYADFGIYLGSGTTPNNEASQASRIFSLDSAYLATLGITDADQLLHTRFSDAGKKNGITVTFNQSDGYAGTWKSTTNILYVVVKTTNNYQIFKFSPGKSGSWTTYCNRTSPPPAGLSDLTFFSVNAPDPEPAKLTVKKEVKHGESNKYFDFTNSGPQSPESFSLKDGETQPFTTGGEYTIIESDHEGYRLDKIRCSGEGKENAVIDKASRKIVVNLEPGDDITCTFTNEKKREEKEKTGIITVAKIAQGGSGSFDFSLSGQESHEISVQSGEPPESFGLLEVGKYSLEEVNVPEGWQLQDAWCKDKNNKKRGFFDGVKVKDIQLKKNDEIICTFTNFKEKDGPMEEITKLFIHRRVDNLLTHGPDRARLLRRLEEQQQPGSLKDYEPLKLVGSMLAGLVGSRAAVEGPDIGPGGTGMIASGRFGDVDHETDSSFTRSRVGGFGSAAFSQLGRGSGGSDFSLPAFKFSTSLSELRMAMQAIEASKEEEKARLMAELGFGGQPYTRPVTGARPGLDIWVEGQMSRYDDSTGGIRREGDFKILYVGADYALSPGILVGTLVQFDFTSEDVKDPDLTGSVDGRGWMAGPYIGIKLTDNLVFDARAAWGTSDNDIELEDGAGWRKGSFDTTRWLATASLTGNWYYGAWRLTPQVSLAYGHEEYDTYKNNLGQTVDGAGISIGRATFGTEVAYRIMTSDGTLVEPHLGISGIWNFDSDDLVINGAVVETNKSRAKLDGGILVRRQDGMGMRAAVSYDGIGESDFEAWSGQVWLNFPLN